MHALYFMRALLQGISKIDFRDFPQGFVTKYTRSNIKLIDTLNVVLLNLCKLRTEFMNSTLDISTINFRLKYSDLGDSSAHFAVRLIVLYTNFCIITRISQWSNIHAHFDRIYEINHNLIQMHVYEIVVWLNRQKNLLFIFLIHYFSAYSKIISF